MPAGRYVIYASRGFEYGVDRVAECFQAFDYARVERPLDGVTEDERSRQERGAGDDREHVHNE